MTLYLSTAHPEKIKLALLSQGKEILTQEFLASRSQAEKLLPAVEKLLKRKGCQLGDLKKIIVADTGSSFTALRIGVLTANALAYALNIPIVAESGSRIKRKQGIMVVEPQYDREPNIG